MSPAGRITFLYEDAGPEKNFGPHSLLRACVADETGISLWDSGLADCRPLKGNGNVVRACWDDKFGDLAYLVAVLDADKLCELPMLRAVGAEARSTERELVAMIQARCPFKNRLAVCLINRNAESLVVAASKCDGREHVPEKSVNVRDRILNAAARSPERRIRDCILDSVPSFAALVKQVVALVR